MKMAPPYKYAAIPTCASTIKPHDTSTLWFQKGLPTHEAFFPCVAGGRRLGFIRDGEPRGHWLGTKDEATQPRVSKYQYLFTFIWGPAPIDKPGMSHIGDLHAVCMYAGSPRDTIKHPALTDLSLAAGHRRAEGQGGFSRSKKDVSRRPGLQ